MRPFGDHQHALEYARAASSAPPHVHAAIGEAFISTTRAGMARSPGPRPSSRTAWASRIQLRSALHRPRSRRKPTGCDRSSGLGASTARSPRGRRASFTLKGGIHPHQARALVSLRDQNEEPRGSSRTAGGSSSVEARPRIAFRCGKRPKRATIFRCFTCGDHRRSTKIARAPPLDFSHQRGQEHDTAVLGHEVFGVDHDQRHVEEEPQGRAERHVEAALQAADARSPRAVVEGERRWLVPVDVPRELVDQDDVRGARARRVAPGLELALAA